MARARSAFLISRKSPIRDTRRYRKRTDPKQKREFNADSAKRRIIFGVEGP